MSNCYDNKTKAKLRGASPNIREVLESGLIDLFSAARYNSKQVLIMIGVFIIFNTYRCLEQARL